MPVRGHPRLRPGRPGGRTVHQCLLRGALLHADALCIEGYAVYTAGTCTDVPRIFERFSVGQINAVAFASLVHGWRHRGLEERPASISEATDRDWQTRNIRAVIDAVCRRQESPPTVLVANELLEHSFYDVTADALAAGGIEYHVYPANDPDTIVEFLR